MTETDGEKPTARTSIDQEHAQVRAIAQQLGSVEDESQLLSLLQEHRGLLAHHFASEETEDGLYDSILEEAPEQQHRVAQFRAQHQDLLQAIDALCAAARESNGPTAAEIRKQARALAEQLNEHESQESSLLLEVFNTDLGTAD